MKPLQTTYFKFVSIRIRIPLTCVKILEHVSKLATLKSLFGGYFELNTDYDVISPQANDWAPIFKNCLKVPVNTLQSFMPFAKSAQWFHD